MYRNPRSASKLPYLEENWSKAILRDKRSVKLTNLPIVFLKKAKELLDQYNEAVHLDTESE